MNETQETQSAPMKYSADEQYANDAEFLAWVAELEVVISEWATKHCDGESPYGGPLAESTGLDCWHIYFTDGDTPDDAFATDRSYWE